MFSRRTGNASLIARLDSLEQELTTVRREAAEARAAHDDAIELAITAAVPTWISNLIADARTNGWTVSYGRGEPRRSYGVIRLEHPDDSVHNTSIEFPLPEDEAARRQIENSVRMRVGWARPAQAA